MTVKEYFEKNSPYTEEQERTRLQHYEYVSIEYDSYLRVAKHGDGRYFVVDYNGDLGIDDTEKDIEQIVHDWYQRAN
jgi:thymidylate kinase